MRLSDDIQPLTRAAESGDIQAQTRLGIIHFSQGRHHEAVPWLELASAKDVPEACNLLGLMYLNGISLPQNPKSAIHYLQRAARQNLKEACYTLANLVFNGIGVSADQDRAYDYLITAARLRHLPALRTLGILYSLADAQHNSNIAAERCLQVAAQGGDGLSQYVLATHCLQGASEARLAEGLYWLQTASEKHIYCAKTQLQRWSQKLGVAEIQRLVQIYHHEADTSMEIGELSPPSMHGDTQFAPEELCKGILYQCHQVLQPLVCEHLINIAMPAMTPSHVVDPDTGKVSTNKVRTSSSMFLRLSMYDFIAGLVIQNLAKLAGEPATNAEPIAVLRYAPGEEYKPHYDYFVNEDNREEIVDGRGGQRTTTVFVYLNDVEAGGETDFPMLQVRVVPGRGKAVKFLNLDKHGQPNVQTLHAGMPVIRGEKWLATVWFREHSFVWGDL